MCMLFMYVALYIMIRLCKVCLVFLSHSGRRASRYMLGVNKRYEQCEIQLGNALFSLYHCYIYMITRPHANFKSCWPMGRDLTSGRT